LKRSRRSRCGDRPTNRCHPLDRRELASAVYLEQYPDVEHYLAVADQLGGEALTR
jgi:hypothetical protein